MARPNKRKCKQCGEVFQKRTPLQYVCSQRCAIDYAIGKSNAKKEKERRDKNRKVKDNLKTAGQHRKELQKLINKIAVLIDDKQPCICRPHEPTEHFNGGHYYSVGSVPAMRWNLHNIHKQSVKSNKYLGGEPLLFREGLIKRYGEDYVAALESAREKYKTTKLIIPEMINLKVKCRKIIGRLKNGESLTRDEVNELLGIYK